MEAGKTSTFTIHHDRCKPADWKPRDVLALANFVRTGDLRHAAELSRLGVELILSEHHVPKGGELQVIGFARPTMPPEVVSDDIEEVAGDEEVSALVRIYRGPVEYTSRIAMGDGDGHFEGYDYTFHKTKDEADAATASASE